MVSRSQHGASLHNLTTAWLAQRHERVCPDGHRRYAKAGHSGTGEASASDDASGAGAGAGAGTGAGAGAGTGADDSDTCNSSVDGDTSSAYHCCLAAPLHGTPTGVFCRVALARFGRKSECFKSQPAARLMSHVHAVHVLSPPSISQARGLLQSAWHRSPTQERRGLLACGRSRPTISLQLVHWARSLPWERQHRSEQPRW